MNNVQRAAGAASARRGYQLTVVKVASVRTDNHSCPPTPPSLPLSLLLSLL